jgi:Erv1 / Alr family
MSNYTNYTNHYSNYGTLYTPRDSTSVLSFKRFGLGGTTLGPPDGDVTHEELKSNDPKVWGPHLWKYMHCSAANYPERPSERQIQDMITWLKTLTVTIPCVKCKEHYGKYIHNHNSELHAICSSKDSLFNFIVDIHNQVNKRNNKPIVTYDQAKQLYCK